MQLNPDLLQVQPPPITEVKSWLVDRPAAGSRPLIDCCQAVPDYPPAPQLTAFLAEQVGLPETSRYTPDEGLVEARDAVSAWYARRYGAGPSSDQICLTVGASQAFWLAMTTLCRAGDEVILTAPAYFDHPMALQALGLRPVWVPFCEQNHGLIDPQAVAGCITSRTRAILLVTPSNPTGVTAPPELLEQLFDLAAAHDLALILDETYNAFLPPDQALHRLFGRPGWQRTLVHLASFGKTFALTGYRAGALIAGKSFIEQALKLQDTMAVCQPRITQLAISFGCTHLDFWVEQKSQVMQRRHVVFQQEFRRGGHPFKLVASGGFFAWVRHPWTQCDSRSVARKLALEADLVCLPGAVFGPGLEPYLRLAFGNLSKGQIPAAVQRLREVGAAD
ncbi:MAG: aminotransferase class I and II [Desulfuromonas sp.]|nr:MAG: aminotransferase class I and II [Desulfuromonas sp.]